jgi:hypothetical protein
VFLTACICEYTHNYVHCVIDSTKRGWQTKIRCLSSASCETQVFPFFPSLHDIKNHFENISIFYLSLFKPVAKNMLSGRQNIAGICLLPCIPQVTLTLKNLAFAHRKFCFSTTKCPCLMVLPDVIAVCVQNYTKSIDTLRKMLKLVTLNKECALERLTTRCNIYNPITLCLYFKSWLVIPGISRHLRPHH